MDQPVNAPGARRYDSPVRREQAEATRRAVLRAARALFTTRGYAETSVAEIARRAGVSVDTVYASVGRKPALLLAVHDMVLGAAEEPVPAEDRDYVRRIREAASAEEKIRRYADALGERLPQTVPLDRALREAGARDPACREVREAIGRRRRANMLLFAQDLQATGRLRPELTLEQVADLVWSMNSPEYFQLLADAGYPPERYADLVADVWTRTLLGS
ncbi:TetR/AcrR family transcriptional regulator [Nocardioides pantholopis]|uniref:TetR/AcrR family transcriptional regulator n=1 Tax=Nocardioides pantholopis TaxID=2483798 RepID=UPI000F08E7BD|nr:TetR/AcrR family transcriptional regulator [Nocardioides pantholopis]